MKAVRALAVAAAVGLCAQPQPRAEPTDARAARAPSVAASTAIAGSEGSTESVISATGVEGDYLRSMHARIHWRWTHNFIEGVAEHRPPTDPLNEPTLSAEIFFTVRWDGSSAEVTLARGSGQKAFDLAAMAAIRGDIPYPVPPLGLFGDDGVAHFRWVLARDGRLCAEGELRRRELPLEDALPRLFVQARFKEALLRVNRLMESGDVGAMAVFARAWLARPFVNRAADINAAAALAQLGDRRQEPRLRPGLGSPETVVVAARALAALKVDLCPLVEAPLRARAPASMDLAMTALREGASVPGAATPGAACVAMLSALAGDEAAPKPLRAAALQTYAALDPVASRRLVILTLADPSPEMRAAAALASGRPGGGRPALYRLEPLLKDPSADVRAAAAGAIVRACGELSFEYLNPLFKNNDDRPFLAVAPALGQLSSVASADLLARMLKRERPALQEAVTRALAVRKDDKARALFRPLAAAAKKSAHTSHGFRLFLYANAPLEEVLPFAKDPYLGILAYKAMLRAKRYKDAADWLVSRFDRVSPEVLGEVFGAWLASAPSRLASQ
jgi:HEAT repeat protein